MRAAIKPKTIKDFRKMVYGHYRTHARVYPWRATTNPYRILVSELMLQQTQADRVVPKYRAFLKQFPTVRSLAQAPAADVFRAWQGLGYNRRALYLHRIAQIIDAKPRFPRTYEEILSLPGVGPYTAGAVMAFAFNVAVPIIETNIRTVYIHLFFSKRRNVSDRMLMPYIEATLDRDNPRAWYAALMDYGAHLKRIQGNANIRSKHYTKQAPFLGSDRQVRGSIVRALATSRSLSEPLLVGAVQEDIGTSCARVKRQLSTLQKEMLVRKENGQYTL